MCWFRPAFAIALDCAATRAGDSAWADRPGLPHRLAAVLVPDRNTTTAPAPRVLSLAARAPVARLGDMPCALSAITTRAIGKLMKKISPPGRSGDEVAADVRRGGDSDPAQA